MRAYAEGNLQGGVWEGERTRHLGMTSGCKVLLGAGHAG